MNDKHTNNGQGELPPENASIEERTMAMVTAYALDQVTEIERKAVEGLLEKNAALRQHVESIRQLGELLRSSPAGKTEGSPSLRSVLTQKLEDAAPPVVAPPPKPAAKDTEVASKAPTKAENGEAQRRRWWAWMAGGAIAASFGSGYLFSKIDLSQSMVSYFSPSMAPTVMGRETSKVSNAIENATIAGKAANSSQTDTWNTFAAEQKTAEFEDPSNGYLTYGGDSGAGEAVATSPAERNRTTGASDGFSMQDQSPAGYGMPGGGGKAGRPAPSQSTGMSGGMPSMGGAGGAMGPPGMGAGGAPRGGAGGMMGAPGPGGGSGPTPSQAASRGTGREFNRSVKGRGNGMGKGAGAGERPEEETDEIQSQFDQSGGGLGGGQGGYGERMKGAGPQLHGGETDYSERGYYYRDGAQVARARRASVPQRFAEAEDFYEQYETYVENSYFDVKDVPLSTFAIDVDTASYANLRRFLNNNQLPPPSSIRMEEMLNYFTYSYPTPTDSRPFAVHLEAAECPWNREHRLVRVGLKGKEIHKAERPSSNLVFLIDTSGSMQTEDKLPLLKSALTMLTRELSAKDRVTIVTYAGSAGLVLPPTSGNDKEKIISTLDQLLAGGSTHGSAGIMLAYEQAKANFIQEGTNRVILCTDGDLNVGVTSDDALVELIKERAKTGVYLSVMGFGTGNLKDGKLEKIADHGNGVYAYIDGLREARKVFVDQMSGSLVTIAKDVKIQLEFNPKQVQAYRLLGYENRVMENKDFRNDKKDAGEIGAGHTVTALYEIVPAGATPDPAVKLKYQPVADRSPAPAGAAEDDISKELLTVRLRYKNPEATENDPATEFETALANPGATVREASQNFRFASAVAMAGLVLRQSQFRGDSNLDAAIEIASTAIGEDPQGWRTEFVDLLRKARALQGRVE